MIRSIFTIYSDDIRQEVGNKLTYVGTYQGNLFANQFPITLARLCVSVFITYDRKQPIKELQLEVSLSGVVLADPMFSPEDLPAAEALSEDQPGIIQANFAFSPLEIAEPGILRVKVASEDQELEGFPLTIEQAEASPT